MKNSGDKKLKILQFFTACRYDTIFAVVLQFPVILQFSVQTIENFEFFQFQNQANYEGF